MTNASSDVVRATEPERVSQALRDDINRGNVSVKVFDCSAILRVLVDGVKDADDGVTMTGQVIGVLGEIGPHDIGDKIAFRFDETCDLRVARGGRVPHEGRSRPVRRRDEGRTHYGYANAYSVIRGQ